MNETRLSKQVESRDTQPQHYHGMKIRQLLYCVCVATFFSIILCYIYEKNTSDGEIFKSFVIHSLTAVASLVLPFIEYYLQIKTKRG